MASPLDPATTALPRPTALALAEAALARQTALQHALTPGTPGTAPGGTAAQPQAAPAHPAPGPLQPAAAAALQLSAQARAQLAGPAAAPPATLVTPTPWPAQGVPVALHQLVHGLVQQMAQGSPAAPPQVVAAQPWSTADAARLLAAESAAGRPLHGVLVAQGVVVTAQGERGLALTLHLPPLWAQNLAPHTPAALRLPFAGPAQALQSGLFALVLQSPQLPAARSSALLVLDFAATGAALAAAQGGLYGRELLAARGDPWLALMALQASGQWRDLDEALQRREGAPPCATPGCPYAGRAPCPQPFCPQLQAQELLPPAPLGAL